jgi:hypothetical protein
LLIADSRTYSEKAFKDYANSIIIGITSGDDKYAHIPQLDLEKCTNECIAKLDWLNSSIAKQNDVAKCAPLVITSDEINRAKSVRLHNGLLIKGTTSVCDTYVEHSKAKASCG